MPRAQRYFYLILALLFCYSLHSQNSSKSVSLSELCVKVNTSTKYRIFVVPDLAKVIVPDFEMDEEVIANIASYSLGNQLNFVEYSPDFYILFRPGSFNGEDLEGSDSRLDLYGFVETYEGKPLADVTLTIVGLKGSVVSNDNGYFIFKDLKPGLYNLVFQKQNFNTDFARINLTQETKINLTLFKEIFQLDEVSVYANSSQDKMQNPEIGVNSLDMKKIDNIPSFMGESDVIKSITVLPGVSSVGDGAGGGINVRGGSSDQNLILFDGAPVFWSSHLFGLSPLFNSGVLDNVKIYKGTLPARYGGRLSSALVLGQKDADFNEFHLNGNVGWVSSRLNVEMPVVKDKLSVLLAGRSSYPNLLLSLANIPSLFYSGAFFYDYNSKVSFRNNANFKASISNHIAYENFYFSKDTTYTTRNDITTLNLSYYPNDRAEVGLVSSYSKTALNVLGKNSSETVDFDLGLSSLYLNGFFKYEGESDLINVDAGIVSNYLVSNQGTFNNPASTEQSSSDNDRIQRSVENALYIGNMMNINEAINAELGLRFSSSSNFGKKDSYVFSDMKNRRRDEIVDTIQYNAGELIKTYTGFEPRFSLSILLGTKSSLKLGYSKTIQYSNRLSNTASIVPFDIWQLSNEYILPVNSNQYSLGLSRTLKNIAGEISAEVYYKNSTGNIDYLDNAQLLLNDLLVTQVVQGEGQSYGAEFMVDKNIGKLTGWFSYSYSRAFQRTAFADEEFSVNGGDLYPSFYDVPHSLSTTLNYKINKSMIFGANFIFTSGRPITVPVGQYLEGNLVVPIYSDRNGFRTAPYHRADVSLIFKPNAYKKDPKLRYNFNLSVYNIYGRRNPYSIYFRNGADSGVPQAYRLAIIGVPFPSLSINFELD